MVEDVSPIPHHWKIDDGTRFPRLTDVLFVALSTVAHGDGGWDRPYKHRGNMESCQPVYELFSYLYTTARFHVMY